MSTLAVKQKNKIKYIHTIVMFLLMFIVSNLPPIGQITPMGMKILGVFIGIIYGWCFIDLLWVSVMGFFAIGLTGYMTVTQAFSSAFANATTLSIFICFAFAECVKRIGVADAIAYWTLSRKILVGKPWLLIIGLMGASFILTVLGGGEAVVFIFWAIIDSIVVANNIDRKNPIVSIVCLFILYIGLAGKLAVPFQPAALIYIGFYQNAMGMAVPFLQFLIAAIIGSLLTFVLILLISKFVFKTDASSFVLTEEVRQQYAGYKFNTVQKVGLILLVVYFVALLTATTLTGGIWSTLSSWGVIGFSVLYMMVFAIWQDENGESVCNMGIAFKEGVMWSVILLFGVTIPLSAAVEADSVGIMATVNAFCMQVFDGWSLTALLIIMVLVIGVLTQIFHNVVMGALFIPIFGPIVVELGGNPLVFFFMIYMALQCAYGTPAGSLMAGLGFGKEGMSAKHAYIYGWLYFACNALVVILGMPLWNLIFG